MLKLLNVFSDTVAFRSISELYAGCESHYIYLSLLKYFYGMNVLHQFRMKMNLGNSGKIPGLEAIGVSVDSSLFNIY